jgi:sigma-B regulation protein RsbU (phosphoserine phosphatase)
MNEVDQKKTVLVVDDAPSNIQIVSSILKGTYKVRVATSGARALELMKVAPMPDLVLLDVAMPDMSGYDVCSRLKIDPETRDVPVIFLTGQTETEDETRGFEVGAVDYIHKPFSTPVVKARVQTHMMLRGMRQQLSLQLLAMQREMQTARQIQLSILPDEIPRIAGLDIAARYIPMSAVAGDFYDFIVVDEKHLGILVADVSGHGMPAALIASMLKIALAAQVAHAADPAQVLSGLNQALCGKFQHHYVTAAYVYIDMSKRSLTYAGAGHPPLLMWGRSSGGVRDVLENGLFLGKFKMAAYSSISCPLAPGDWVLLYTDGIPETTNPSDLEFGTERFRHFLLEKQYTNPDQLADALLEDVSQWSARQPGEDLNDDITVVVIQVTGG